MECLFQAVCRPLCVLLSDRFRHLFRPEDKTVVSSKTPSCQLTHCLPPDLYFKSLMLCTTSLWGLRAQAGTSVSSAPHHGKHTGKAPQAPTGTSELLSRGVCLAHQCCSKAQGAAQPLKKDVGVNVKPHFGQNTIQHGLLPSNHREASLLCYNLPIKSNL